MPPRSKKKNEKRGREEDAVDPPSHPAKSRRKKQTTKESSSEDDSDARNTRRVRRQVGLVGVSTPMLNIEMERTGKQTTSRAKGSKKNPDKHDSSEDSSSNNNDEKKKKNKKKEKKVPSRHLELAEGFVVGCDEVGRGPACGPLVAAAVFIPMNIFISGINDSKKVNAGGDAGKKRIRDLYTQLTTNDEIIWCVAEVSAGEIDELHSKHKGSYLNKANMKAMCEAVNGVAKKIQEIHGKKIDLVIVDGQNVPGEDKDSGLIMSCKNAVAVEHGDSEHYCVAAASIIAKVYRDDLMIKMAKKYPGYDLENNKGYKTPKHTEGLKKLGKCEEHRHSYNLKDID